MKFIKNVDCYRKKVFLRVDFNVPMDDDLNITDDSRIRRAMLTIKHLIDNEAAIIIASHLGKRKDRLSLGSVSRHLAEILGKEVKFCDNFLEEEGKKLTDNIKPGEILFLENLRFNKEEEDNDKVFAKRLADLCDIYVNDAFGLAHRAHASVSAIVEFAKTACAGFLFYQECDYLAKVIEEPRRPLIAIIGGAKASSKIKALKNIINYADGIIIAGVVAHTFLKAKGYDMRDSRVEEKSLEEAVATMKLAEEKKIPLYFPIDCVAAKEISSDKPEKFSIDKIPAGYMSLDVGPASIEIFKKALQGAGTIVWSGAVGVFEVEAFGFGTEAIAKIITDSSAFTLIGGGDTGAAINKLGLNQKISYISTGGGAFLSFLGGNPMPAVEALDSV